jgi:signal recognition particle subunit SRP54
MAASRKKRVATGAGLDVSDLNKLLKQHKQMAEMMKKMGKGGMMKQAIKQMMGAKGVGGGMPDISKMSPAEMEAAAKGMKEGMGMGGGFPGMPRGLSLPSGLSGLMKKK